jgi:hypothetical protein
MQWVTREHPKTDRIACPWLIRRFIDPHAEILYVPADQVLTVAERQQAIFFGAPATPTATGCAPSRSYKIRCLLRKLALG